MTHRHHILRALPLLGLILGAAAGAQMSCDWSLVDPPDGLVAVTDIAARDANEAFAFGYYEGLIRWDGNDWSVFPIDDPFGDYPTVWLDKFCLAGDSHLYLCGRGDTGPFSNDQVLRRRRCGSGGPWRPTLLLCRQ